MSKTELSKDEKIEKLEQRIEDLEDQHDEEVSISRRTALGGGALGLGALLGGGGALTQAGTAKAQVASTGTLKGINQIGTSDERVETLFVDEVDELLSSTTVDGNVDFAGYDAQNVGSLGADEASVGTTPRPEDIISNTERTIFVPSDEDSVNDALDRIKKQQRHYWEIRIEDGYNQAEDLLAERFHYDSTRTRAPDENTALLITSDNNRQTINSAFVTAVKGNIPVVFDHLEIAGSSPYDDENTGICVYGSDTVALRDITFSGGTDGILSYDSVVMTADIDFGSSALSGDAMVTKHAGRIFEQRSPPNFPSKGDVGGYAFNAKEGEIRFDSVDSTLSGAAKVNTRAGKVYDYADNQLWGIEKIPNQLDLTGNALEGSRGIEKLQRSKPSPANNRAYIYLSDGSDGTDSTGASIDTGDLVFVFTDGAGTERSKIIVDASTL